MNKYVNNNSITKLSYNFPLFALIQKLMIINQIIQRKHLIEIFSFLLLFE